MILTKLRRVLAGAHAEDIICSPAKTDEPVEPPCLSPSFIESFGAASMLLLAVLLIRPFNLITFVAVLEASLFGRTKRVRAWPYGAATVVLLALLPVFVITSVFAEEPGIPNCGSCRIDSYDSRTGPCVPADEAQNVDEDDARDVRHRG